MRMHRDRASKKLVYACSDDAPHVHPSIFDPMMAIAS